MSRFFLWFFRFPREDVEDLSEDVEDDELLDGLSVGDSSFCFSSVSLDLLLFADTKDGGDSGFSQASSLA